MAFYKFPFKPKKAAELAKQTVEYFKMPLTLRQIFYQLEQHHGLIPPEYQYPNDPKKQVNVKKRAYKALSRTLTSAREKGRVPWHYMIDNNRKLDVVSAWVNPRDYVDTIKTAYKRDLLQSQPLNLELWCEKEVAIRKIAEEYQVPLLLGGGYRGKSNIYEASKRFKKDGRPAKILYLGDFDPSGLDIDRDLEDSFINIFNVVVKVERVFLNRADTLRLPSKGYANKKDSRYRKYAAKWNTDQAWELDALNPTEMLQRVQAAIQNSLDMEAFNAELDKQEEDEKKIEEKLKNL